MNGVHMSAMSTTERTVSYMGATPQSIQSGLNPVQRDTLDAVLAVGGERPVARPDLIPDLMAYISDGTRDAVRRWTETSVYLSKSQLMSVLGCEGRYKASKQAPRVSGATMFPATAQGQVVHRALQISFTHPHVPIWDLVQGAVAGCRADERFEAFWNETGVSGQSDVVNAAASQVTGFLTSWPALSRSWTPRFEELMRVKVGPITLDARVDLVMGIPRHDLRQSMVVVDWKSGGLREEHDDEAAFHALVAALRFKVPPFRSFVYSLAEAAPSAMEVTEERLFSAAGNVVKAVNSVVDVMTEARAPELQASKACSWCPLAGTCEENLLQIAQVSTLKPSGAVRLDAA